MEISGAIHLHSHYSYDATSSLEDIRRVCEHRGLAFAAVTEHTDRLSDEEAQRFVAECIRLSDHHFTFIPGFEVPYLGTHVLVIGTTSYHADGPIAERLARWRAEGALLVLAHPHRNGYCVDETLRNILNGVEIWNSQYDGIHAPRAGAWRLKASLGPRYAAFGSLDLHRTSHINGPCVVVDTPSRDAAAIVSALREHHFTIRRGGVSIGADGALRTGNRFVVRAASIVMPAVVTALRRGSSLLARAGYRSFGFKRWLRERV